MGLEEGLDSAFKGLICEWVIRGRNLFVEVLHPQAELVLLAFNTLPFVLRILGNLFFLFFVNLLFGLALDPLLIYHVL